MNRWTSLLLSALLPAAVLAAEPPPDPGTALITGSDRGIGFALVQEFESRGWQVIATTIDPDKAMPGLIVQPRLFCHAQFAEDVAAIRGVIEKIGNFDFGEPFSRVREALGEARKMGVTLRNAA